MILVSRVPLPIIPNYIHRNETHMNIFLLTTLLCMPWGTLFFLSFVCVFEIFGGHRSILL